MKRSTKDRLKWFGMLALESIGLLAILWAYIAAMGASSGG